MDIIGDSLGTDGSEVSADHQFADDLNVMHKQLIDRLEKAGERSSRDRNWKD